ncbi:hypothetical protein SUDANB151_04500 [Streptomyces sp. enrichment culture]
MGADDDVHRALAQPFQGRLRLGVGLEAGQRLHVHRELRVPLAERAEVLLHQQRGRDEDGDLLAVLDGLEGGADRDLRLAVADVAADQAVHRDRLLHVVLDLGDGGELVRRLRVGEGVLQLALPGGVRAERVARRRHPRAVELDQVGGDLLDRLLGARLGLGPVGAAEPVQGGGLATDVLGDLLQLVGGDVEAVAGLAALGGRVLHDQVLAGGALDGALHHLDVAADAVLLVDDVVAGLQGERVDGLAAPGRHPGALASRGLLTGQVGLGEHGQLEDRVDEAVVDRAAGDVHDRGAERAEVLVEAGGDALAAEDLDGAGGGAVALGEVDRAPAVGEPALGVGQRLGGVTAVGLGGVHAELEGVRVARRAGVGRQRLVGGEGRDRPPHHVQLAGPLPDIGDGPQGGRVHVDRGLAAARGGRPGGLEELLRRRDQVGGPRPHPLRVADHGHRALGQYVEQQLHVVHQDGGQGLHALHRDALGDLAEQFAQLGVVLGEGGGTLAHVLGQQQLTAGRGPQAVLGDLQGALVGDLEVTDLLDVVAPELDPQRVLLGRREDVQDAAAHGELAALLDQLDARVRGRGQGLDDLFQVGALSGAQGHGLQVAQALDLRLEHGAYGGDDDGDRAGLRVVGARVGQAAQDGEAAADGVAAGAEPLVRKGLPGGVLHDALGRQQGAQGRRQVLGLAARRRHRQHRAARVAGQGGDREGAGRGWADEIDVHAVAVCGRGDRFREGGVLDDGVEQTVQAH